MPSRARATPFGDRVVHGQRVGAVHRDAGNAVGDGLVGELRRVRLHGNGGGVGELVVLDDEDVRQRQRAGHRQRLVEVRPRGRAVTAEGEANLVLPTVFRGEGHPGRDREVGRDVAGQVVVTQVQPAVVQGAVPAAGGRGGLAHEAGHHLPRLHPPVQVRAEVTVDRRHVVVRPQRGRRADADRLVPVPGVQGAEQVAALVHGDHPVLHRAGEHHRLVDAAQQRGVAVGHRSSGGRRRLLRHLSPVARCLR